MGAGGSEVGEGEALAGRVTEFVRVGNTVHRPASANTESMRQLLMHLEQSGFGGAPRVVGSGPDGGVVLTWIEGWVPADSEAWKLDLDALCESVGELLRAYHGCAQGFTPDAGYEEGPQSVAEGQIVCHGDVAPRNTVFRDGRAVAFIDWDGIWVSEPIWDLAHAVWQFGPVCADGDPLVRGWPAPPNRSERIAALVGGYRLEASQARLLADRSSTSSPAFAAAWTARRQPGTRPSSGCETKGCWTTWITIDKPLSSSARSLSTRCEQVAARACNPIGRVTLVWLGRRGGGVGSLSCLCLPLVRC